MLPRFYYQETVATIPLSRDCCHESSIKRLLPRVHYQGSAARTLLSNQNKSIITQKLLKSFLSPPIAFSLPEEGFSRLFWEYCKDFGPVTAQFSWSSSHLAGSVILDSILPGRYSVYYPASSHFVLSIAYLILIFPCFVSYIHNFIFSRWSYPRRDRLGLMFYLLLSLSC
jgi:hypothetical protein